MSFSKDIKKEILDNGFNSKEHALAFLCGLIYSSAEYEVAEDKIKNFVIPTDVDFLIDGVKAVSKMLFNRNDLSISEAFKIIQRQYYNIEVPSDLAQKMLLETKALLKRNNTLELNQNIDDSIINSENGLRGLMAGAFIGCGTSSIKVDSINRNTTGYHVELSNQNYALLSEIANVLAQFEILAKLTKRKNLYVLYIKDAEEVSNMLALMGASGAVLKLQNEIVTRQVRNKINRQNNCFTSNYTKTLNASFKQLEAIKAVDAEIGLYNLPEDLQQVALLRLANTEESLEELLKLSKYQMTKSALNHKFNKIIKLAEKLKGNQ
ncbi:MAG: DNA-binding protein WhiA [Clostridia bacterium]|nr:DNA-binding protein WhiA [Clostridia bacterium]